MTLSRADYARPSVRFLMSDTKQEKPGKKPDPTQKSEQPAEPVEVPKDKGDAPRRMRWPADFPAKH
jgi:hypothetical protein